MTKLKFYIKERWNPQLASAYYVPMGQLTKKDAKEWEKPLYGVNVMHSYDTEADYKMEISALKLAGKKVRNA